MEATDVDIISKSLASQVAANNIIYRAFCIDKHIEVSYCDVTKDYDLTEVDANVVSNFFADNITRHNLIYERTCK